MGANEKRKGKLLSWIKRKPKKEAAQAADSDIVEIPKMEGAADDDILLWASKSFHSYDENDDEDPNLLLRYSRTPDKVDPSNVDPVMRQRSMDSMRFLGWKGASKELMSSSYSDCTLNTEDESRLFLNEIDVTRIAEEQAVQKEQQVPSTSPSFFDPVVKMFQTMIGDEPVPLVGHKTNKTSFACDPIPMSTVFCHMDEQVSVLSGTDDAKEAALKKQREEERREMAIAAKQMRAYKKYCTNPSRRQTHERQSGPITKRRIIVDEFDLQSVSTCSTDEDESEDVIDKIEATLINLFKRK